MKIWIQWKKVTVNEVNFEFNFWEFIIPTNQFVTWIINLLVKNKLIDKPKQDILLDKNLIIEMDKWPIYPKLYTQLAILMKEKPFPTTGNEYIKANYILSSFFEACERCGESCFSIIDTAKPKKQTIKQAEQESIQQVEIPESPIQEFTPVTHVSNAYVPIAPEIQSFTPWVKRYV